MAGLDTSGAGAVYTYDAVGSYERVGYAAQGQGQKLIIPLLDDIVGGRNRADAIAPLTLAAAVETVKEAFIVAGERDIYTGDAVEIFRCGGRWQRWGRSIRTSGAHAWAASLPSILPLLSLQHHCCWRAHGAIRPQEGLERGRGGGAGAAWAVAVWAGDCSVTAPVGESTISIEQVCLLELPHRTYR